MTFEKRISIGNLLTMVMIAGSVIISTVEIVHSIDSIAERVTVLELRVMNLEVEHKETLK